MTGIYFAEICLIGLFFITPGARPQGIVMVIVLVITILFQIKLGSLFDPLITYLPIDIQEELMSKVQEQKLDEGRNLDEEQEFQGQREQASGIGDTSAPNTTPSAPKSSTTNRKPSIPESPPQLNKLRFQPSKSQDLKVQFEEPEEESNTQPTAQTDLRWRPSLKSRVKKIKDDITDIPLPYIPGLMKKKTNVDDSDSEDPDTALQRKFTKELTHEELTAIAFQHEALRARPPILWIPDDELGIARDEIYHTNLECGDEIAMSCEGATLDGKGKIVWLGNPPDYTPTPAI
jgi:calcium permeable stress-gated cation channel